MPVVVGESKCSIAHRQVETLMGMYPCSSDGVCFLREIRRNVTSENEVALNCGCLGWWRRRRIEKMN